MEPENANRTLMPRKDEPHASRPIEGGALPASYHLTVSQVPSLWDYWPIVLRHKWTILSAMLVALLSVLREPEEPPSSSQGISQSIRG
jgi:hypothetical protein